MTSVCSINAPIVNSPPRFLPSFFSHLDWLSEEIRTMSVLPFSCPGSCCCCSCQGFSHPPTFRSASSVHQFYKFHFGQNLFISIESVHVLRLGSWAMLIADICIVGLAAPPLDMSIRCNTALGSGSQKYMGSYRIVIPLYSRFERGMGNAT